MGDKFKTIDQVLEYIRDHGPILAKAKADRIYLQEYRKSLKAILFSKAPGKTVADKENWAYSHPDYLQNLEGIQQAVEIEERERYAMKAAELFIEVWRSREATNRAQDRSHL